MFKHSSLQTASTIVVLARALQRFSHDTAAYLALVATCVEHDTEDYRIVTLLHSSGN